MTDTYSAITADQCLRLESYIKKHGSITTIYARHELDIVQPAARVHTLRHKKGLNIITVMVKALNPNGSIHPFANYILKAGRYGDDDQSQQHEGDE